MSLYKLSLPFSTLFSFVIESSANFVNFPLEIIYLQNKTYSIQSRGEDIKGNSNEFILTVNGFESEQEALDTGLKLQCCLSILATKLRIGIDLSQDMRVEVEGISANIEIKSATWQTSRSDEDFIDNLVSTLKQTWDINLGDKEGLVLELYSASRFELSPRAQFLTLMTLLEVFVESIYKEEVDIFNQFDQIVDKSKIHDNTKKSIKSSLHQIMIKRDTKKGLEKLAQDYLDKKEYFVTYLLNKNEERKIKSKSACKFLVDCYRVRCNLVHDGCIGHIDNDKHNFDFDALSGELNRLVSELLLNKLNLE